MYSVSAFVRFKALQQQPCVAAWEEIQLAFPNKNRTCEILVFRRGVLEYFAVLQMVVVRRRFGVAYLPPLFKYKAVQEFCLRCLTRQDGTDSLYRNVAAQHPI